MVEKSKGPMIGRRAFATAALCSLSALVALCVFEFPREHAILLDQAEIRAVGDEGCLGRSCKMSDSAAAKDLNHFFQSFLDKGPHAGRKTAHIKRLEHSRAKTIKLSDSVAAKDLDHYYESLPSSKTDRVRNSEVKSEYLPLLADKESRKDLDNYYDNLKTGPGRKAKILEAEMNAKREAFHLHLDGVQRRKEEEQHIIQIEAKSVIQARKDKQKFAKTEQVEQDAQDKGHEMEAVPSARQSTTESRRDAGKYFDSLQLRVHKTKTVLNAEKAAEAQAHTDMSMASQSVVAESSTQLRSGWLSQKDDKAQQEQFFDSLKEQVHKTPQVLRAEEEAEAQAKQDMHNAAASFGARDSSSTDSTAHALSQKEADEDEEKYFESLNSKVHKTANVLKAEARARALAMEHKAAVSVADNAAARKAQRAAPAVDDTRISAKAAREQLARAIDAFPVNKRPHPKVHPAVGDAPLSAAKAREKLDQAIDSFPVHKTAKVLRAEAIAKATAAADLAESSAETESYAVEHSAGPARLSAAAAAAEQHTYFRSLRSKVHKTARVLRAEARARAAAAAVLKHAAAKQARRPARSEHAKNQRLSLGQAKAQQERYFKALNEEVDKTRTVLQAEKQAEKAAARSARAAATITELPAVAPAVATGGRLSAAEARRELDRAVDSLPAHKLALPHVAPAVGDTRLSAAEARKELDLAVDAFPVHKTATVLRAEAAARADADRRMREGREAAVPRESAPTREQAAPRRLSAREARLELDRAIDAFPVHKVAPPAVKPAVGDARLTAAEARAAMRKAIDAMPVGKTPLVLRAEAAAEKDKAEQARFRAEEVRTGERAPAAAVPSGQLSARQSRADLDRAIDSLPVHRVALPDVEPAVGDARLTASESRALLRHDIDALAVHKTASVMRAEAVAAVESAAARRSSGAEPAAAAAPIPLDRRLSAEEARKEMDAAIDALPHSKKQLPHIEPAVGDARLTAKEARKEMDAAMDALPHSKAPLPHVKAAVGGRLSTAEARKEMDAAVDALPHAKGPLPHGEPAVPAGRLAADAARRDMDGFFDGLPLPHHALPQVAPAVGDSRLAAAPARRELVQDLARLRHS